jgi:DNA-directed RNA polymerase specialized sigma24 family protein
MALPIPVDPHFLSGRARPEAEATGTFDYEAERRLVKARLDERRRRVYELRFERGLSVRATAAELGCTPGQVRRDLKTISSMAQRG